MHILDIPRATAEPAQPQSRDLATNVALLVPLLADELSHLTLEVAVHCTHGLACVLVFKGRLQQRRLQHEVALPLLEHQLWSVSTCFCR